MSTQPHSRNSLLGAIRGSNLLVLTTLGAVDGTIFLLAAGGTLATLEGAVVTGLTVIGGAGAWLTAQEEFGQRNLSGRDWSRLGLIAALAVAATLAAAAVGAAVAGLVELVVLPKAAGVVLILIAADIAGADLPRVKALPLPVVAVLLALVLEVALWIL